MQIQVEDTIQPYACHVFEAMPRSRLEETGSYLLIQLIIIINVILDSLYDVVLYVLVALAPLRTLFRRALRKLRSINNSQQLLNMHTIPVPVLANLSIHTRSQYPGWISYRYST